MFRRSTYKVIVILNVLTLMWILIHYFPAVFDGSNHCDFPVAKQYVWLGENVGEKFMDNSLLAHKQRVKVSNDVPDFAWKSDNVLARAFTKQQHTQLMNITLTLAQLLEASNVTYMMSFGTLLGSYIFHDVIPWDDDMDFLVDVKDLPKVKAIFQNEAVRTRYGVHSFGDAGNMWALDRLRFENATEGLNLNAMLKIVSDKFIKVDNSVKKDDVLEKIKQEHAVCKKWLEGNKIYYKAKFYALNAQQAGIYNWTWPFVDMIFYESVGDEICTLDLDGDLYRMCQKKSITFPLTQRPLGSLWLPAPKDSRAFLHKRFPRFACMYGTWDHVHERFHQYSERKQDCEKLLPTYPVVRRSCDSGKNGRGVTEQLFLGDTLLRSLHFPNQQCPTNSDVFSLA